MPLRHYSDGVPSCVTAICDRCLRIGPTRASQAEALQEGGFQNPSPLAHGRNAWSVLCIEPCMVVEGPADPPPGLVSDLDLSLEGGVPTAIRFSGLAPMDEMMAAGMLPTPPDPWWWHTVPTKKAGCPRCGHHPTRFEVICDDVAPFDPGEPCPGCGLQADLCSKLVPGLAKVEVLQHPYPPVDSVWSVIEHPERLVRVLPNPEDGYSITFEHLGNGERESWTSLENFYKHHERAVL